MKQVSSTKQQRTSTKFSVKQRKTFPSTRRWCSLPFTAVFFWSAGSVRRWSSEAAWQQESWWAFWPTAWTFWWASWCFRWYSLWSRGALRVRAVLPRFWMRRAISTIRRIRTLIFRTEALPSITSTSTTKREQASRFFRISTFRSNPVRPSVSSVVPDVVNPLCWSL